jgi:hypothetical protein
MRRQRMMPGVGAGVAVDPGVGVAVSSGGGIAGTVGWSSSPHPTA